MRRGVMAVVVLGALVAAGVAAGAAVSAEPRPDAMVQDQIDRGEYLVTQVAMCVQCHTPRDARGELIPSKLLQGAPMPANWLDSPRRWAYEAPKIAGLPGGWTEDRMLAFLQTGERPGGFTPKPPMPPFRMSEADATAVVAYLKSLR